MNFLTNQKTTADMRPDNRGLRNHEPTGTEKKQTRVIKTNYCSKRKQNCVIKRYKNKQNNVIKYSIMLSQLR
jgi:hypothetical protein